MELSKTLLAVVRNLLAVDKTLSAVACGSYNVACGCLRLPAVACGFQADPFVQANMSILVYIVMHNAHTSVLTY